MQSTCSIKGTSMKIVALKETISKATSMGSIVLKETTSNWGILSPNQNFNLSFLRA
jgi:hypothetical protein